MTRQVAPSILAADFGRIREQVQEVIDAGAGIIHVDVMDGHFVPPLSMGPGAVEALRDMGVVLDVHLMIEAPERQVEAFAKAGAHNITVHAEATPHVHATLQRIRELGCRAGLAFCPSTPPAMLAEVDVDIALCMSVNPGWGGQAFIPSSPAKLERMRALLGDGPDLEVDGGVDRDTAGPCADAGATLFVAGSAVFGAADPGEAFREIAVAAGAGGRRASNS
jgi:ribulose-phosphate 3-epimerase